MTLRKYLGPGKIWSNYRIVYLHIALKLSGYEKIRRDKDPGPSSIIPKSGDGWGCNLKFLTALLSRAKLHWTCQSPFDPRNESRPLDAPLILRHIPPPLQRVSPLFLAARYVNRALYLLNKLPEIRLCRRPLSGKLSGNNGTEVGKYVAESCGRKNELITPSSRHQQPLRYNENSWEVVLYAEVLSFFFFFFC